MIPIDRHNLIPTQRRRRPSRHAFTMIEMLTAIAIVLILVGILTVGLGSVIGGTQERQTRTQMELLRNMLSELNRNGTAADAFRRSQVWLIYRTGGIPTGTAINTTAGAADTAPVDLGGTVLTAPPSLGQDDEGGQFYRTARVMSILRQIEVNRSQIDSLPGDRRKALTWTGGTPPTDVAELVLDAWGNPILFVPDGVEAVRANGTVVEPVPVGNFGGLGVVYSDSRKQWYHSAPLPADVPDNIRNTYTRAGDSIRSRDKRSFFYSAGPDGNYRTHDDNLYSFEN